MREGSFSRAARALEIAQPTISARIRALEGELGGPLFTRRGRAVALTPRGESFLPYAQRALAVLAEGVETAALIESGQRGRVTVGTVSSLAGGLLAAAIARFRRTHPQVELFVRSGHSDQVVEMVLDGVVQVGLLRRPVFNVEVTPLLRLREPLVLVVPAGSPLAGHGRMPFEEVVRQARPLLLVRWGPSMRVVLARVAGDPANLLEVPIETVRHLLAQGVGATFLTGTLAAEDLAAGRVAAVAVADLPPLYSDSTLVCRGQVAALPRAVTDFVAALRTEAGDLCLPADHS